MGNESGRPRAAVAGEPSARWRSWISRLRVRSPVRAVALAAGAVAVAVLVVAALVVLGYGDDDRSGDLRVAADGQDGSPTTDPAAEPGSAGAEPEPGGNAPAPAPEPAPAEDPDAGARPRGADEIDRQRRQLDPDVAAVQRYYQPPHTGEEPPAPREPDPDFDLGGIAFDTVADPVRLRVTFRQNVEVHRAALLPLLTHPERVDIVAAEKIDMVALSAALDAELPAGTWWERPTADTHPTYSGRIGLWPGQVALAERLLARHGTALRIQVGAFPYPVVAGYGPVCRGRTSDPVRPDVDLEVFPARATWARGEVIEALVIVTNRGASDLTVDLPLQGELVGPGNTAVSVAIGPELAVARWVVVGPGQRSEPIPVTLVPASCDPAVGSTVAAGTYDLVVRAGGSHGRAQVTVTG